jgi:hypothetical protein
LHFKGKAGITGKGTGMSLIKKTHTKPNAAFKGSSTTAKRPKDVNIRTVCPMCGASIVATFNGTTKQAKELIDQLSAYAGYTD